ncbi:hypothetical protein [Halomicrobium salinisoli]|uniref:hypothetical protein n=1 Tax=Halomicrobium salinisoli TaxID=2878391 RepID=UPI001CF06DC1|nr:hypothetical protein [Halomicrobium salinisoli]
MATGVAREMVGESIRELEDRFGSFPVNQTTLRLSPEAYADALERAEAGVADLYVRVENAEGKVLHVPDGKRPRVPRCVGTLRDRPVERARRAVREATGVACTVDDVARVTIAGVRNGSDADAPPAYRLLVLFEGSPVDGTSENGVWRSESATPEFV